MNKHNFKNYIFGFLSLFTLFVISEFAYILRNNTPQVSSRYLALSKYCHEHKYYSCEGFFLKNASEVEFKYFKHIYPDKMKEDTNFSFSPSILEKFSPDSSYFTEPKFAYLYYQLGINAYNGGDLMAAVSFWEHATYLSPELSYAYAESANLYQVLGDNQSAVKVLNRCLKFNYPKKHCQDFLDTNIKNNITTQPGFLNKSFSEFFASGYKP